MVAIRIRPIRPRRAVKDTTGLVGDLTNDVRTVAANGQRWIATYSPQTLTATVGIVGLDQWPHGR